MIRWSRRQICAGIALLPLFLLGCSGKPAFGPENFVGRWRSSRSNTPIQLLSNGEWRIVDGEGTVLQQGVWQLVEGRLLWSFKLDGQVGHDANTVLSVSAKRFELRERDGTVTVFDRLD